jgi:hypothetical protein
MATRIFTFMLYILLCVSLLGCNLPTQATAEATITETALPTETPSPEPTATQPPTETPAPTATETATAEPSATPTIAIPIADVFRETNCRTGPAGNYDLVAIIDPGTKVEILATDLGAGYYWFIRSPENAEQGCWLLAQNAKIEGDVSALPAFTPIPSPTSAPAFKVAFKNFDFCKGSPFVRFSVTNTGDVQFRSAYVKVTDSKTKEVQEHSLNAFDLTDGCIIARNVAPLLPGQNAHVQSPVFIKDPRNNRLNVVITLCTEQNLSGICVTQTLEIKP